jgi:hypothetical protein
MRWIAASFGNQFLLALFVLGLCAWAPLALADECRTIKEVKDSAVPDQNSGMGGHVLAHIFGETPPTGHTHDKRTLFKDRNQFLDVWQHYIAIDAKKTSGFK